MVAFLLIALMATFLVASTVNCAQPQHMLGLPAKAGGGESPKNSKARSRLSAAFLCASYTHAYGSSFGGPGGGAFGHAGALLPVSQPCQGRHPRLRARAAVFNRKQGAITMAGSPLRASAHTPSLLRRLVRPILLRAAVRGHISWLVALRMLALMDGGAQ
jgi:hypothetical protein